MKRSGTRQPIAEINVVPYIDVMLVLLVIFMITTPLLSQGVDIDLPQVQSKTLDTTQSEPIIVSVDSRGRYYLNIADKPEQPISAHRLMTHIAAEISVARQNRRHLAPVLVKGDRYVSYGKVIQAMVLLPLKN